MRRNRRRREKIRKKVCSQAGNLRGKRKGDIEYKALQSDINCSSLLLILILSSPFLSSPFLSSPLYYTYIFSSMFLSSSFLSSPFFFAFQVLTMMNSSKSRYPLLLTSNWAKSLSPRSPFKGKYWRNVSLQIPVVVNMIIIKW